jgi:hypothetical protein
MLGKSTDHAITMSNLRWAGIPKQPIKLGPPIATLSATVPLLVGRGLICGRNPQIETARFIKKPPPN